MKWLVRFSLFFVPVFAWGTFTFFAAFEGAWLTPVAQNSMDFKHYVKREMSKKLKGNGAAILLKSGEIDSEYFQTTRNRKYKGEKINQNTMFPLASMSKLVASLGLHQLEAQEHLSLQHKVSKYLSQWQLPDTGFDNNTITLEMLLSHTGGLTDGLGFGDYHVDDNLPSLVESLNNPRASIGDKRIEVNIKPGTEFAYSGGGYLMLELLMEETTGIAYEAWMTEHVLRPAGMHHSGYGYLLSYQDNASSLDTEGRPVDVFQYASSAATAMNASAADLTALVKYIYNNKTLLKALQKPLGKVYGEAIWGAGAMLYSHLENGQYILGHDGSNDPAINTTVRLNPITGDALIVLVTGHQTLASELGYEWTLWQSGKPDFIFADRAIGSALFPFILGALLWWMVLLLIIKFKGVKGADR